MTDEYTHLKKLEEIRVRRLRKLEMMIARKGNSAEPEWLIDKEDTEDQINEIRKQITRIDTRRKNYSDGKTILDSFVLKRIINLEQQLGLKEQEIRDIENNVLLRDRDNQIITLSKEIDFIKRKIAVEYEIAPLRKSDKGKEYYYISDDILNKIDKLLEQGSDRSGVVVNNLYRDARDYLELAIRHRFGKPVVYCRLAEVYYYLDENPQKIFECCQNSLKKSPDYHEARLLLCRICGVLANYNNQYRDEAISILKDCSGE